MRTAPEALRRAWNENATTDPLYAILTGRDGSGMRRDETAFFESGRLEIRSLFERLYAQGITPRPGRALDFGCGIGRLSEALAERFAEVKGIDVSDAMVALARKHSRHANVEYLVNVAPRLDLFPDGHFDFCLSHLVLQHTGRRLAIGYLQELARVLAPGGIAEVEVPVGFGGIRGWLAAVLPRPLVQYHLRSAYGISFAFTYPIRHRKVVRLLTASGARVLEAPRAHVNPAAAIRSYVFTKSEDGSGRKNPAAGGPIANPS